MRTRLAALLLLVFTLAAPAFPQAPPPVPVIPDANRYESFNLNSSTTTVGVTFPVFGDCEDITVMLNGAPLSNPLWACASASGNPLDSIALPITDMQVTFSPPLTTGFLEIIGNWNPRRLSQPTQPGINRYEFNETASGLIAGQRELFATAPPPAGPAGGLLASAGPGVNPSWLPAQGAVGQVLTSDGPGALPLWATLAYSGSLIGGINSTLQLNSGVLGVNPIAVSPSINVLGAGMKAGGADNAPYISALMNLISSPSSGPGYSVAFPPIPGQPDTIYYFSQPLSISRGGVFDCGGSGGIGQGVSLVFAPGVDGVINESDTTSSDGNYGEAAIKGCIITSLGLGSAALTSGSTTVSSVNMPSVLGMTPPPWASGDGIIAIPSRVPPNSALTVPTGAYIDSVSGTSLTLHTGFAATYTSNVAIWRLPGAQVFNVTTTSGSSTFTVTGGPRLLQSGDVIWSDAFPFGSMVSQVSGTVGAQTVSVVNVFTNSQNATVTHTAGSGNLWIVPASLKRRVTSSSFQNLSYGFPIGLQMNCLSGSSNCTTSYDERNYFEQDLVGRWVAGDNTGASTSQANIYAYNSIADIMEAGTIGSFYSGDNSNSAESSYALYGIIGNCSSQNYSMFAGMYIGGYISSIPYCLSTAGVGAATVAGAGPMNIGPMYGGPSDMRTLRQGTFTNQWSFMSGVGNGCSSLGGDTTFNSFQTWSPACTITGGISVSNDSTDNRINFGNFYFGSLSAPAESFTLPTYTGYKPGGNSNNAVFPHGFLLGGGFGNGTAVGSENAIQETSSAPSFTGKQGDISFNAAAVGGSFAGWANDGTNYKPFGPVANDNAGTDYTIPNIARTGSSGNKDMAGRITLSSGTASYALTGTYATAPHCVGDDESLTDTVSITPTTTALYFRGTGTDTISWICVGGN